MSPARTANCVRSPYPEGLAAAWEAAIADRLDAAPTVVSLFAGGGGSSTGYHMAGYRELLAVDWEKHAEACFEANYPHIPFWQGDITKLTAEEAMSRSGVSGPGELDLLDGSPPCFAAGTPVLTWRGVVPIERVDVGDRVLTHRGRWRRVTHVMSREADTVVVDRRIETTPDHPFWSRPEKRAGGEAWTPAGDVSGRFCATVAEAEAADVPEAPRGFSYDEDFWYFLGRRVGHGWLRTDEGDPQGTLEDRPRQNAEPVPCLNCGDPSEPHRRYPRLFTNYCSRTCARLHKHRRRRRPRNEVMVCAGRHEAAVVQGAVAALGVPFSRTEQATTERFTIGRKSLTRWLERWFGRGAAGKTMPGWALGMGRAWRASLFRGYMAADGDGRGCTTVSRCLAVSVAALASTLGKTANIEGPYLPRKAEVQGRPVSAKPAYGVRITEDGGKYTRVDGPLRWRKVRRANRPGRAGATVYDITVDEDHSFFADVFAVHNCQGFSTAGKRELYDTRNSLFMDYVRLLKAFQPRALVMENVSGMVKGKMKVVFAQVLRELKSSGYKVRAWLLNAQWFGVPQARERMIFIGAREDLGIVPTMPRATHTPVCVRDALEGVPGGLEAPSGEFEGAARELWDKMRPGWSGNKVHPLGHFFNFSKADPDRPAPTILKYVSTSGKYAAGLAHWAYPRMLSIPEIKRLQSFPDGFQMPGKFADQWARIGNSVPPLMMRAVAAHVRRTILDV